MSETETNRIEVWVQQRRANRVILWLLLIVLVFIVDSLLAFTMVFLHVAKPERFYVTSFLDKSAAAHRDIPYVREQLQRRGRTYPSYFDRFEGDGLLGARLVRNFLTIEPPYFDGEPELTKQVTPDYWFATDEFGFPLVAHMEHHYAVPKPAHMFRVIIVGGSTVEGFGVNSPYDSLPSKLALLLEKDFAAEPYPGFDSVELINAGVSNYTSDQEYLLLLADLDRFDPDLVIAYDGWNDAEVMPVRFAGEPRLEPYRTPSQVNNGDRINASFTPWGIFKQFSEIESGRAVEIITHFAIPRMIYTAMQRLADSLHKNKTGSEIKPEFSVQSAVFYLENRDLMLTLARQRGYRFASFLQPVTGVDGKTYTAEEVARQRVLADRQDNETVRAERATFYDSLRPALATYASKNNEPGRMCVSDLSNNTFKDVKDSVYADSGHLTTFGNEVVAAKILSELKRCKLLPN